MNLFYKYKFYLYPFIVFFILALVILSFKLLQTENVNSIEQEKKIPLKTRIIYPEPIKPQSVDTPAPNVSSPVDCSCTCI